MHVCTSLNSEASLAQVLINAGQANAATGDQGYENCLTSARAVCEALSISPKDVLLLSTGAPLSLAPPHSHANALAPSQEK